MKFRLTADGMAEVATVFFPVADGTISLVDRLKSVAKAIAEHIERNKLIYKVGAITFVVLTGLEVHTFAAGLDEVIKSGGIDEGARKAYKKLVNVGKWVIIIKGAFDAISSTVQGDFIQARKSFLAYLLVYVILLGLPWAFGQIEVLFDGM
ncbi:hypothetical protein [Paenibacillus xanthanilyticus]|uniref:Uncharacterized protein n=1 Tax=Paenibacillus xanthanilyticus TaxID=1783531 RepID=A0ABV8KC18_9BACL